MQFEGNDPLTLVLMALFMPARLGPIFVLPGVVLSVVISIVAFRKKLIGLSLAFLIIPFVFLINAYLCFQALSNGEGFGAVTTVISWTLGLAMLIPFVITLFMLKRIPANHRVHSIAGSARSE